MRKFNMNQATEKTMLVKTEDVKTVFFPFQAGEGIQKHTHNGTAVLQVVVGEIEVVFSDGKIENVQAGEIFMFDARVEHSVNAVQDSKVLVNMLKG